MSKLVDHSKTLTIFLKFFNEHPKSILTIFKSSIDSKIVNANYYSAYINFFIKILNLGNSFCLSIILNLAAVFTYLSFVDSDLNIRLP
jgi:hypothetical protein